MPEEKLNIDERFKLLRISSSRYLEAPGPEKSRILDSLVSLTAPLCTRHSRPVFTRADRGVFTTDDRPMFTTRDRLVSTTRASVAGFPKRVGRG